MDTFFFISSKIIWALATPGNLAVVCLAAGVGVSFFCKRGGRIPGGVLIGAALALLLVFGVLPVGHSMLHHLETRVVQPQTMPARVDGILVLGGAINTRASQATGQPQFNEGVERVLSTMALARRYPDAKIVFSGGSGLLTGRERTEAVDMKIFLDSMDFDSHNVFYEDQSRNTYENIHNSFTLMKPPPGQVWVLVTSAFHMPRSLAIADKTGWIMVPYPVDYRSHGRYEILPRSFDVLDNLYASHLSSREFIGSLAYSITGKL